MGLLEQCPVHHADTSERPRHEVVVEADDYDSARAQMYRQVPDGWRIAWLRTL